MWFVSNVHCGSFSPKRILQDILSSTFKSPSVGVTDTRPSQCTIIMWSFSSEHKVPNGSKQPINTHFVEAWWQLNFSALSMTHMASTLNLFRIIELFIESFSFRAVVFSIRRTSSQCGSSSFALRLSLMECKASPLMCYYVCLPCLVFSVLPACGLSAFIMCNSIHFRLSKYTAKDTNIVVNWICLANEVLYH